MISHRTLIDQKFNLFIDKTFAISWLREMVKLSLAIGQRIRAEEI